MPMIAFREDKCRDCARHRINGGACLGPGDKFVPCQHICLEGRAEVDWIDKTTRGPTAEDADSWGHILVWDVLNGHKITGYNNRVELARENVTHFARTPRGPKKEVTSI